jgi:UDP-N-acetylglucosamine 4,6-dehydratase
MQLDGKSILITGGTGSFGREAVRSLLATAEPRRLVVFSRDELKQSELQQEFPSQQFPCLRFFIGDVRDKARLTQAAALKQVEAAEYNPMECIKTNIHGAENVIHAALANNVEMVVALSTDKAASPVNLYGATKLASDKLFVAANNIAGGHRTRFAVVRYGNVVGSRGSVVPYFRKLVANGATSLPVTDPRMTRFWIRLEDGVSFAFRAFDRMHGGEIFIPKIPSVRIVDVAAAIAPDLPHDIIGIRPGEKIHEVMCTTDDSRLTVEFDDHYVIRPSITFAESEHNYARNASGETGKYLTDSFEYESGTNPDFLSIDEIANLNASLRLT